MRTVIMGIEELPDVFDARFLRGNTFQYERSLVIKVWGHDDNQYQEILLPTRSYLLAFDLPFRPIRAEVLWKDTLWYFQTSSSKGGVKKTQVLYIYE